MVRVLVILGLLCFAVSGWLYYDSLPPPLCTIDQPERELTLSPQSEHEVIFTLTNPTNAVVRVVGLADC